EALVIAPDGLHDAGPGVADAHVAGAARAAGDFVAVIVIDDRVDAGQCRAGAARFHGIERGDRAAQEAAVFRLPPSIADDGLPFADLVEIPVPGTRFDGFAHRGHVLELLIAVYGHIGAGTTQGTHCSR